MTIKFLVSVVIRRCHGDQRFKIHLSRILMFFVATTATTAILLMIMSLKQRNLRASRKVSAPPSLCKLWETGWTQPQSVAKMLAKGRAQRRTDCFACNISVLMDEPGLCQAISSTIDVIFLISSDVRHVRHRNKIRKSWAHVTRNNTSHFRHVFLLGTTVDVTHMEDVRDESEEFHDLLVGDFLDSYWNLTFKTLMGLHWAATSCQNASFFMKTDDDVWHNTDMLTLTLRERKNLLRAGVGGFCKSDAPVVRTPDSKWCVPKEYYPDEMYPPYCYGFGYVAGLKVAAQVVAASRHVPFFLFDDVYVGMCLNQTGIKVHSLPGFVHHGRSCKTRNTSDIAVHDTPDWRVWPGC